MAVRIRGGVNRVTIVKRDGNRNIVRSLKGDDAWDAGLGIKFVAYDPSGRVRRGEIIEEVGPRKKQSKLSRALDKRIRKMTVKNVRVMSRYLKLHDRSNSLKKNGWMRDLTKNLRLARRKP
jgi:hypothetical protein